ncbi:MAG: DsrE family protein [Bacteroidales bacterium]|nr:DsrE family protein [Bacteroidales bacterium]
MKRFKLTSIYLFVLTCMLMITLPLEVKAQDMETKTDKLAVLWTSGDIDVAEKSCLMYTHAAKRNGWFDEVVLIVWGSSSRLLAENEVLQEKVKAMIKDGVILEACIACSNMLGVTEELKALGIDVKGMGVPLTNYMKSGYHVLSY